MSEKEPPGPKNAQERLASQDWTGVAKSGIAGMTPAETGWILAFVILFAVFQISNYLVSTQRQKEETAQSEKQFDYFIKLEESRAAIEENRSQEHRRLQESLKECTQALGRRHEYEGRAGHEARLLNKKANGETE